MYEYEYELHNFHELPEIHELHEIHDELYVLRHVCCCVATIIWPPNRLVFLSEWQYMIVKLNFPPTAFGISKGQLQLQFSVRIAALRIVHCIGRRPSIAPANRIAGNCIASIAAANGIARLERDPSRSTILPRTTAVHWTGGEHYSMWTGATLHLIQTGLV